MAENRNPSQKGYDATKWRMLLATMFCYMFYYTGRQTFGFAINGIQEEFGLSYTTLGSFGMTLLWAYAVGQAVNGNLGDKYGGRIMMSLGALLSCGFNWIVSFAGSFWGLFIPWVGNGFAQSMGWAPGSRVVSNWFGYHERGRAFGLYTCAAGMSSVFAFTIALVVLKVFELNWRWLFRLPPLLLLIGGMVYYIVVRNKPEDLGFEPPTDPGGENEKNGQKPDSKTSWQRYKTVLRNWRFIAASIAIGFQSAARYGLLFWVPVHFLGRDWKNSDAAWISVALPFGMALGALIGGWVSDKIFNSVRWKLISLFMTLAAIASITMYFLPKDHWAGIGILFMCGFFAYGSHAAFWALCPDLLSNQRAGTGTGIMNFSAYFFAGIATPLIGWMIESHSTLDSVSGTMVGNTALVFPVVAAACMISAIIGLFIRR